MNFVCYILKMIKKIVISRFNNIAAILHNNKIQEIVLINDTYQVNDIYIGTVQKIFSSINAAFVKLNKHGRSGFIHISDMRPIKKKRHINHITEILSINQLLLVQIIKEPTTNKGPRLTTNINLSGRYIVLMPFCNTICISQKVQDRNERIYLNSLAILLKPSTMGIIVRSSAQGVPEEAIIADLHYLKKQWSCIEKIAMSSPFPSLIYKEKDLIKKITRDNYTEKINNIIIDSEDGSKEIKYHLNKWLCTKPIKLQVYKKNECILNEFNIKQAIVEALHPEVKLSSGGYLIIESNEALTVIDVNSGSFNKSDNSKETILRTNFYAASEIAHQLKIRNINGVIIIDFIDMLSQQDQLQLLEHFNQLLKLDHAKPQIVQLSELGLVELTRRRRGQSLQELFNMNSHSYISLYNKPLLQLNDKNRKLNNEENFLLNESIKYLFFHKKFIKNIPIVNKILYNRNGSIYKKFICIGTNSTIHLLDPKKNYIVPITIYSELISNT
uniref:Ribonuclease E n=1 Tax=Caulacanthus okamurae TaxID=152008 RepID=A0A6H1U8Q6_9FLOR|nr:ribonuclease E [Caulacanthus okamurae]QIZ74590.1 ribonuclease E [Caulacanthus okamurae]